MSYAHGKSIENKSFKSLRESSGIGNSPKKWYQQAVLEFPMQLMLRATPTSRIFSIVVIVLTL